MGFRPLGDRVLVKINKAETVSRGGILIPDAAQEKPHEGTVIAVGPGKMSDQGRLVEPNVKKGDVVMLPKYVGTEIKLEGEAHLVLSEEEIIGVLD